MPEICEFLKRFLTSEKVAGFLNKVSGVPEHV